MSVKDADTTAKEGWVMHIHTPADIQVFNWDDRNSLPRELVGPQPESDAGDPGRVFRLGSPEQLGDSDGQTSNDTDSADDLTDTDDATPLTD